MTRAITELTTVVTADVRADLAAATTHELLERAATNGAQIVMERHLLAFERELELFEADFDTTMIMAVASAGDGFAAEYRKLERLSRDLRMERVDPGPHPEPVGEVTAPASPLLAAEQLLERFNKRSSLGWKIGASVGAVVGTIVLPVVGTGIGAALGAAAHKLFIPNLARRRVQFAEQLEPGLRQYFAEVEALLCDEVDRRARVTHSAVDKRIDFCVRRYRDAVQKMVDKQAGRLRHLRTQRQQAASDLTEIKRRRELLLTRRNRLARAKTR